MKFRIENRVMSLAAEAVAAIVPEARVIATPDGITISGVDYARVCAVRVKMPKESFETYESHNLEMGISAHKLLETLSSLGKKTIDVSLDADRKLSIKSDSLEFQLGCIAPDLLGREPQVPELSLKTLIAVSGEDFKKIVTASKKLSPYIEIRAAQNQGAKFLSGNDIVTSCFEVAAQNVHCEQPGEVASTYSLNYLQKISKAASVAETVHIRFDSAFPMELSYKIGLVEVWYLLAPRVPERDDE